MITYRKAVLSDAEKLAEIRSLFLKEINDGVSEEYRVVLEQANLEYLRKTLHNNTFIAWIALDNEKIISTSGLSFSIVPPFFNNTEGKVAYISNMYTLPKYRHRGIGAKLLKRLIDEAKQFGCKKITLNATKMGRQLYEKYGFIEGQTGMNLYVE